MGVLAPGSAHARPPPLSPYRHQRKFFGALVLGVKSFQVILSIFRFFPEKNPPKNRTPGQVVLQILCTSNLIFWCELKPHAKFRNPTITPSGRKVTQAEERKKKEVKAHVREASKIKNRLNLGHCPNRGREDTASRPKCPNPYFDSLLKHQTVQNGIKHVKK
jgi:hypothetical protein